MDTFYRCFLWLLCGVLSAEERPEQPDPAAEPSSSGMTLSLVPAQNEVYAGQALRVDLTWEGRIEARALKDLRLNPAFFENPDIEVVIPRHIGDADSQVGLPIGGRRVIATREFSADRPDWLGTIRLPIFLRFAKPGIYELPATRLDIAVLEDAQGRFGRYAAYFNNSFFEGLESSDRFKRIHASSGPRTIEVRALPPDPEGRFSGWFEPVAVGLALGAKQVDVGDLIEIEVRLSGRAPHGMWALPDFQQQAALDERFLLDTNWTREWHEQGTIFRSRLRVLSTTVIAFPELEFLIFDPEAGDYKRLRTEVIPLRVEPNNGDAFIHLNSFADRSVPLTDNEAGIWHNLEMHPMNEILNIVFRALRASFWPLMLLTPVAFALLVPVVLERRRRALDPRYRLRAEAYAAFRKIPECVPEKWAAFLHLMAVNFDADGRAWTRGDSESALRELGADAAEIEALLAMHDSADVKEYSARASTIQSQALNQLAKRVMRLAARSAMLLAILIVFSVHDVQADEWSKAQALFARAQAAAIEPGAASTQYSEAALKFEATAEAGLPPGISLYNAGNAWFQAGEMGRAIAAYRQAQEFRPFDSLLSENLAAARAMVLSEVPDERAAWRRVPSAWLKVTLVGLNIAFFGVLLLYIRFRNRSALIAVVIAGLGLLVGLGLIVAQSVMHRDGGVVIADSVIAKKGPGYAYTDAFNEPLHDGAEFVLIEQRDGWGRIELSDGRQCWVPTRLIQIVTKL